MKKTTGCAAWRLLLLSAALVLAACGNKGPLVLPDDASKPAQGEGGKPAAPTPKPATNPTGQG